ncbi:alpha/beta fold hydrolase [Curtobacterium sp. RRHDQ10]|uniref:alpha/beta fold hydrolase n=1 Tax=Curtobacterium phyllosphaerae TaxID=3413379 RepID=UPI003BF401C7
MRALVETVVIDGATVRLRTLAPAGRTRDTLAPTVVLVHGLAGSSRSVRRLHEALSRGHRTIAVDLPGFGGVPDTARLLRAPDFAAVLEGALRAHDVVDCLVVGHGFGGQVAVELGNRAPDLATSVGLLGPVVDDRRRQPWRQAADLVRDWFREPTSIRLRVTGGFLRSVGATLPLLPSAIRQPLFKRVADLGVPVLVVRGHADALSGHDWGRRLVGVAGEGALIELPGAHHVHEQQPGPVAAIVDEFLRVQSVGRLR